jgi:phosphatidylserine/phosphatidylglycerophosphate/cardiolipin synthase-like enzyme
VIEPLLALPAHLRERLVKALETKMLVPPYYESAVTAALGDHAAVNSVSEELVRLDERGIPPVAIAMALRGASRADMRADRPALVWSGPEVRGLHARDTREVYDELVGAAQRSLWISTFTYYDGPKAFKTLAQRMHSVPELQVTLLVNIQRRYGDTTPQEQIVVRFASQLWERDWPGPSTLEVFYDPRSLDPHSASGVLHAKAVVADEHTVFVTSANLTEAAFERNIEVGVLSRDKMLAASLATHFRTLVEQGLLLPLPSG